MIWMLLISFYRMLGLKPKAIQTNDQALDQTTAPIPDQLYKKHFRKPIERPFYKDERKDTTVLIGGLSGIHDKFIAAALCSLGIRAEALPPTKLSSFELGREYGNNGYCNPTYFTVGNLIAYLRDLEKSGFTKSEINEKYVFLTAGCNAPCRFGLIEIEYRMALKEAGYQGFRVLVFKKEEGLHQSVRGLGIEINPRFILAIVNAINLADVLTGFTNGIRPFENIHGQTNRIKEKAIDAITESLRSKKQITIHPLANAFLKKLRLEKIALFIAVFYDQLTSKQYVNLLTEVAAWFNEVELDPLRSKTVVKVTGELWAGTTDGEGNFNMHSFLESEGAVVLVEPVATYIQFMLHKHILRHTDRREVILNEKLEHGWQLKQYVSNWIAYKKKLWLLQLGYNLYRREYSRLLHALGGYSSMLVEQNELQELAHPYYHSHIEGGEGYMEVGKNIYYHQKSKCHMVLSLKPFGCMPSTQSDGVQAAVVEHYKNMVFLPLETSGEGKTNAHNRVLMALADAREKSKTEMKEALSFAKHDAEELRHFINEHPELKKPSYRFPKRSGVAGRAPNFVYHVEELLQAIPKIGN
jgi:predicted nucleotide-binding protein (sugar kinase/HSP70/actin superfamily)